MPTTSPIAAPPGWTAHVHLGLERGPDYTCPRCHREVPRHTQHVVAFPEGEQYRHWHRGCFDAAVREGIDRYRWG